MKYLVVCLLTLGLAAPVARAQGSLPADQFDVLMHEHLDGPCVIYNPARSPALSLIAWQRDTGLDLPTNQLIYVVREQSRLTLPAGTPFGDAGAPFWILPQSQNPELLYLGISVERVPAGIFNGPIAIQVKRFDGPGYLMVWQATGPGQYNIRINTRDGLSASDGFQPLVGAHEHFNWGFSTTGVYCVTFQAVGRRIGESTNITSLESTFLFHVRPLPPPTNYATWAKSHWPPGFNPPTTLTNGNADSDLFDNLHEYAFGLSPTNANPLTDAPLFSFVTDHSERYGALTFTRYKPALDLGYSVQATSALPGGWTSLTDVFGVSPNPDGLTELITIRDALPATNRQRFFRLNVNPR